MRTFISLAAVLLLAFQPTIASDLADTPTLAPATSPDEWAPIASFPPRYPREALLQGVEGWVRIQFTVEADGSVSNPDVIDAHPRRGLFDQAALDALAKWRYEPATRDGQPIATPGRQMTIEFRINKD